MCERTFNDTGDNGEGDPPVLIPNTEVKPFSAGSTWLDTAREIKTLPVTKRRKQEIASFFVSYNVYSLTWTAKDLIASRTGTERIKM